MLEHSYSMREPRKQKKVIRILASIRICDTRKLLQPILTISKKYQNKFVACFLVTRLVGSSTGDAQRVFRFSGFQLYGSRVLYFIVARTQVVVDNVTSHCSFPFFLFITWHVVQKMHELDASSSLKPRSNYTWLFSISDKLAVLSHDSYDLHLLVLPDHSFFSVWVTSSFLFFQ